MSNNRLTNSRTQRQNSENLSVLDTWINSMINAHTLPWMSNIAEISLHRLRGQVFKLFLNKNLKVEGSTRKEFEARMGSLKLKDCDSSIKSSTLVVKH